MSAFAPAGSTASRAGRTGQLVVSGSESSALRSRRLKLSALAVHGKLDERARYLDDTEQAVETSLAGVAVSNKETEKRRKA